jgi:hypothetical protein
VVKRFCSIFILKKSTLFMSNFDSYVRTFFSFFVLFRKSKKRWILSARRTKFVRTYSFSFFVAYPENRKMPGSWFVRTYLEHKMFQKYVRTYSFSLAYEMETQHRLRVLEPTSTTSFRAHIDYEETQHRVPFDWRLRVLSHINYEFFLGIWRGLPLVACLCYNFFEKVG